jgi:hypothetical protein
VLLRSISDCARALNGVRAVLLIREEAAQRETPTREQSVEDALVNLAEVEGPDLEVAVVQEVVARGEVNERSRPCLDRPLYSFSTGGQFVGGRPSPW